MSVGSILLAILEFIVAPFQFAFYEFTESFQDGFGATAPIDVYLFSDNKLFSITPHEIFSYVFMIIVFVFIFKFLVKFIKWLFSIPKRLGGIK